MTAYLYFSHTYSHCWHSRLCSLKRNIVVTIFDGRDFSVVVILQSRISILIKGISGWLCKGDKIEWKLISRFQPQPSFPKLLYFCFPLIWDVRPLEPHIWLVFLGDSEFLSPFKFLLCHEALLLVDQAPNQSQIIIFFKTMPGLPWLLSG